MADIRHFEFAYLISLFASLIDIIYIKPKMSFAASFLWKYYLYDLTSQKMPDANFICLANF